MGLRYVWEMSHNEVNISNVSGPGNSIAYDTDASSYMCLFKLSEMYAIGSTVYAPLYQKYSCSENNGKTFDVPAGCMVVALMSSTGYITNPQQLLSTYPYRYSNSAGTITVRSDRDTYYNASGMYGAYFTGGNSISDGKISSENSSQYPSNAFVGKTKYVLQGSDNVDPAALSYTDPVKAGSTIHLTITPSSGNVYGGTITYTIQTTTNGEDYYDAGTTTGTSFNVVVPTDAVIWNVRVYAKDDMGFISSTYVYGNNITPWVTVIQSEIVPASGDLGYLTSKNIVAIGVTHLTETTYSLSANLNGSPCFSASDVPIADATFITLEDETWNGIPEDTEQTLDVTITFTGSTDTRNYTFKKFTYDDTSLEGVMEGTARAIRIKREYQTQILGKNLPKEIIKLDNPINSSGLKEATASEAQVFKGYTFFAGDSELRTGVALATPATVDTSKMFTGVTAYNQQGQLITGNPTASTATAADILKGKKAYNNSGKLMNGTLLKSGTLISTVPQTLSNITSNGSPYTLTFTPPNGTHLVVFDQVGEYITGWGEKSALGGVIIDLGGTNKQISGAQITWSSLGTGGSIYTTFDISTISTSSIKVKIAVKPQSQYYEYDVAWLTVTGYFYA